jgi:hypothetical protein
VIKSLKRYTTAWLVLMLTTVSTVVHADSQIVNVASRYNSYSNPQYLYLPAGEHAIEYIGPDQGGRHTARNAWRGITMWCIYAFERCELGWQLGVLISGEPISIPPKYAVKRRDSTFYGCRLDYFLAMRKLEGPRTLTFASPETAIKYARASQHAKGPCGLKLVTEGFIKLSDSDFQAQDNLGGTSVRVLTALEKRKFLIDILPNTNGNVLDVTETGTIEVAIFGDDTRDVSTIRAETLSLLPDASPLSVRPSAVCKRKSINDDGYLDLSCLFQRDKSEVGPGATRVHLAGLTTDNKLIHGWDVVTLR